MRMYCQGWFKISNRADPGSEERKGAPGEYYGQNWDFFSKKIKGAPTPWIRPRPAIPPLPGDGL